MFDLSCEVNYCSGLAQLRYHMGHKVLLTSVIPTRISVP